MLNTNLGQMQDIASLAAAADAVDSDGGELMEKDREHYEKIIKMNEKQKKNPAGYRRRLIAGGALLRSLSRKRSMSQGSNKREFSASDPLIVGDRKVILQGPVQLCIGSKMKSRYAFLYHDILIIAKQKSATRYHLKNCVHLGEVWLGTDLVEIMPDYSSLAPHSFLIGWPTINMVISFASSDLKTLWFKTLREQISMLKRDENPSVVIKIIMQDQNFSMTKGLMVGSTETAKHLVMRCLQEFRIAVSETNNYQLWVLSDKDQPTICLSGVEHPYSIYMNHERSCVNQTSAEQCSNQLKFQFMRKRSSNHDEKNKTKTMFQRKSSKSVEVGKLFGRELNDLSEPGKICPPILGMLSQIFLYGPLTTGIFRRTASHGTRQVKAQLDSGRDFLFDEIHIFDTAALLKEFLRCLPNCLLCCQFYPDWTRIAFKADREIILQQIKTLVHKLPESHLLLLRHLVCVLNQIAQYSDQNLMTSYNLSICISQCLLWPELSHDAAAAAARLQDIGKVNGIVQALIDCAEEIFGSDCLHLFDHLLPLQAAIQPDHSLDSGSTQSIASNPNGYVNDSAMSLEGDYYMTRSTESTPRRCQSDFSPAGKSLDSYLASSRLFASAADSSVSTGLKSSSGSSQFEINFDESRGTNRKFRGLSVVENDSPVTTPDSWYDNPFDNGITFHSPSIHESDNSRDQDPPNSSQKIDDGNAFDQNKVKNSTTSGVNLGADSYNYNSANGFNGLDSKESANGSSSISASKEFLILDEDFNKALNDFERCGREIAETIEKEKSFTVQTFTDEARNPININSQQNSIEHTKHLYDSSASLPFHPLPVKTSNAHEDGWKDSPYAQTVTENTSRHQQARSCSPLDDQDVGRPHFRDRERRRLPRGKRSHFDLKSRRLLSSVNDQSDGLPSGMTENGLDLFPSYLHDKHGHEIYHSSSEISDQSFSAMVRSKSAIDSLLGSIQDKLDLRSDSKASSTSCVGDYQAVGDEQKPSSRRQFTKHSETGYIKTRTTSYLNHNSSQDAKLVLSMGDEIEKDASTNIGGDRTTEIGKQSEYFASKIFASEIKMNELRMEEQMIDDEDNPCIDMKPASREFETNSVLSMDLNSEKVFSETNVSNGTICSTSSTTDVAADRNSSLDLSNACDPVAPATKTGRNKRKNQKQRLSDPKLNTMESHTKVNLARSKSDSSYDVRHRLVNDGVIQDEDKENADARHVVHNLVKRKPLETKNSLSEVSNANIGNNITDPTHLLDNESDFNHEGWRKRRSYTVRNRDWHKELAQQYSMDSSSFDGSIIEEPEKKPTEDIKETKRRTDSKTPSPQTPSLGPPRCVSSPKLSLSNDMNCSNQKTDKVKENCVLYTNALRLKGFSPNGSMKISWSVAKLKELYDHQKTLTSNSRINSPNFKCGPS